MTQCSVHTLLNGQRIAYHKFNPRTPEGVPAHNLPGIIFLGGYKSDMTGSKATFLEVYCKKHAIPFIRFDYTGHGESSGEFTDGTMGGWADDAVTILDHVADKTRKHILIGSSMGGWVMLLATLQRPERVAGLLGIAAAPDFSEDLIWDMLKPEHRHRLMLEGVFDMSKDYCPDPACEPDPYPVSMRFIEEARSHLLMKRDSIAIACPVRLLHGMQDKDVPYQTSLKLAEKLERTDVVVTLVKDGGHRMSTPEQLAMLEREVDALLLSVS